MDEVKNKSSTASEDLEAKAVRGEFGRTVKNYIKVIDMIQATPRHHEPASQASESHLWTKLLNNIFKKK